MSLGEATICREEREGAFVKDRAQVVASHSGFASVRGCCIPCPLYGSSAWKIEKVQGLDGSEMLALVELTFMDSIICACPQRLMTRGDF